MKNKRGINTRYNPFVRYLHATTGITLIALVITIIVMLILAGVSLNVLVGDNGVLTQAQEAKTTHEAAEEKELVDMAIVGAQMNKDLKIDYETLKKNIEETFGANSSVSKIENEETGYIDYIISLPSGKTYSTSSNLKILDIFIEESKPVREETGIGVVGYMLELNQKIGLRFYFTMPDERLNTGATIKLSKDGETQEISVDNAYSAIIDGNSYYYVTAYCAAKEMSEDITFCMYDESGEAISDSYTYSIKAYGNAVIANEENYVTELKQNQVEYIKALLYYGGMAQLYFAEENNNGQTPDNLASEGIEIDTSYITAQYLSDYQLKKIGTVNTELLENAVLVLDNQTVLMIIVNEEITNENKEQYKMMVDGDLYEIDLYYNLNKYSIVIPVKITEYDYMYEIYVTDNDGNIVSKGIKYGIYSFIRSALDKDDMSEKFKETMRSMVYLTECGKKIF